MQVVLLPSLPLQHRLQAGLHPPSRHLRDRADRRGEVPAGAAGQSRVAVQRQGEAIARGKVKIIYFFIFSAQYSSNGCINALYQCFLKCAHKYALIFFPPP